MNGRLAGGAAVPRPKVYQRLGSFGTGLSVSNTPACNSMKLREPVSPAIHFNSDLPVAFLGVEVVREDERLDGFVYASTAAPHFHQLHRK